MVRKGHIAIWSVLIHGITSARLKKWVITDAYGEYATASMAVYGGQTVSLVPISSTNYQLQPSVYWIKHTLVHYNKAHIGQ